MKKNNITSLDTLNEKIDALHARKEELEDKLENNWEFLQDNYSLLIRNSIFKRAAFLRKNTILNTVLSIPKVQDAVSTILDKVSLKIEELIFNLLEKAFPKKD